MISSVLNEHLNNLLALGATHVLAVLLGVLLLFRHATLEISDAKVQSARFINGHNHKVRRAGTDDQELTAIKAYQQPYQGWVAVRYKALHFLSGPQNRCDLVMINLCGQQISAPRRVRCVQSNSHSPLAR